MTHPTAPRLSLTPLRALLCGVVAAAAWLVGTPDASAHGLWGHIHVTGWAIENLPDGELATFFEDPEVFNAALFGAAFTDSGYLPQGGDLARRSRAYSEHTHWEPFIRDFVAWIRQNDPPPWETLESKKRVAFLMGCASHGLQDEVFDSLFLPQVEYHDHGSQENADPGTDGFLALDANIRFEPEEDLPLETLLELYQVLDVEITEEVIRESVRPLMSFYINHRVGIGVAENLGRLHEPDMPWTRVHYLDPRVPGSLRSEIYPTARYLEALWERLHGRTTAATPVVSFAFPEAPRRLLGHEAATADSWVTFIFGTPVRYEDTAPTWVDDLDNPVPFTRANTRWNHPWPRLISLRPGQDLQPGGWYTATLPPGAETIDGFITETPVALRFQVECLEDQPGACEDLGEIPVATIDDPNPPMDMPDADMPDAEVPDDTPDAETLDDAPDAQPDQPDAEAPDDEDDTPDPPAALPASQPDDGCTQVPSPAPGLPRLPALTLLALIAAAVLRRRRSR